MHARTEIEMKAGERALLENYRKLSKSDQQALLKFSTFLVESEFDSSDGLAPKMKELPRPKEIYASENESVVGAIKRLSESYFMLDKACLLDETSVLMSQHVMQGRSKADVILALEQLFQHQYEKIKIESETQ